MLKQMKALREEEDKIAIEMMQIPLQEGKSILPANTISKKQFAKLTFRPSVRIAPEFREKMA